MWVENIDKRDSEIDNGYGDRAIKIGRGRIILEWVVGLIDLGFFSKWVVCIKKLG